MSLIMSAWHCYLSCQNFCGHRFTHTFDDFFVTNVWHDLGVTHDVTCLDFCMTQIAMCDMIFVWHKLCVYDILSWFLCSACCYRSGQTQVDMCLVRFLRDTGSYMSKIISVWLIVYTCVVYFPCATGGGTLWQRCGSVAYGRNQRGRIYTAGV